MNVEKCWARRSSRLLLPPRAPENATIKGGRYVIEWQSWGRPGTLPDNAVIS